MAKAVEVFNVLSKMCDAKYRGRPFLPRLRREYQSHTASIERTVTADDGRIRPPLASLASREANHGRRYSSVGDGLRSEEHTSELQSLRHLVCRLLLEKKK